MSISEWLNIHIVVTGGSFYHIQGLCANRINGCKPLEKKSIPDRWKRNVILCFNFQPGG